MNKTLEFSDYNYLQYLQESKDILTLLYLSGKISEEDYDKGCEDLDGHIKNLIVGTG